MIKVYNLTVLSLQLEDLIARPLRNVLRICATLKLECYQSFVDGVLSALLDSPNPTRNGVDWTELQIETVNQMVTDFPKIFQFSSYNSL